MASADQLVQIGSHRDGPVTERLPDWLAITAACAFVFIAAYRIKLPGLYFDELIFADAAQGNLDSAWIHLRWGSLPVFIMGYLGALKAWVYVPIFRVLGVSAMSVRLPMILLAAVTLLIFYRALRGTIGAAWAAAIVWIMALDPANIFPSRLDWGPTVLMHFFQAAIFALWFSFRDRPKLWKLGCIFASCALGFFDKFNFIWLAAAFALGVFACYPDSIRDPWRSSGKVVRWTVILLVATAVSAAAYLIFPLMQFPAAGTLVLHLRQSWNEFQITLSGAGVAEVIFGSSAGIIAKVPYWLTVTDACLALVCLLLPMFDIRARENRKNGVFCLLVGFLIFLQIVITPQAGGPHHHSMLFPFPLLGFAFLARCLYDNFRTKRLLQVLILPLVGAAATCIALVNIHNTTVYLSHFRNNPHYRPLWSPAIYALASYINEHGFESAKIISVDCCLHNQLRALAPKKLRRRIRDFWPAFKELPKNPEEQESMLKAIFPEGKTLVVTFDASKETFPETRPNFLALLAAHPEISSGLVKEFWYGGEKIYEIYEVVRPPHGI